MKIQIKSHKPNELIYIFRWPWSKSLNKNTGVLKTKQTRDPCISMFIAAKCSSLDEWIKKMFHGGGGIKVETVRMKSLKGSRRKSKKKSWRQRQQTGPGECFVGKRIGGTSLRTGDCPWNPHQILGPLVGIYSPTVPTVRQGQREECPRKACVFSTVAKIRETLPQQGGRRELAPKVELWPPQPWYSTWIPTLMHTYKHTYIRAYIHTQENKFKNIK